MLITSSPGGPPIVETAKHRIGIRWLNGCRDLFQIQFHESSIFIHFPYQPDRPGVISRRELPPGTTHTFEVTDTADATTKRVKYSHPIDGHAHFSQDGQIRTTVRNQADRLDRSIGHFFSIEFGGITLFRNCKSRLSPDTAAAQFSFNSDAPVDPLHCAGYWLRGNPGKRPIGLTNPVLIDQGTGQPSPAMAIAPPSDSPLSGGVLAIFARPAASGIKVDPGDFILMFTGGFEENLADANAKSSFLAMQYPIKDIADLPIVDYERPVGRQSPDTLS